MRALDRSENPERFTVGPQLHQICRRIKSEDGRNPTAKCRPNEFKKRSFENCTSTSYLFQLGLTNMCYNPNLVYNERQATLNDCHWQNQARTVPHDEETESHFTHTLNQSPPVAITSLDQNVTADILQPRVGHQFFFSVSIIYAFIYMYI